MSELRNGAATVVFTGSGRTVIDFTDGGAVLGVATVADVLRGRVVVDSETGSDAELRFHAYLHTAEGQAEVAGSAFTPTQVTHTNEEIAELYDGQV